MKPLFAFALVPALALVAATGPLAQENTARPAKVFVVAEVRNELTRNYPAIVLPSAEVELSFRVSGRVVELPVRGAVHVKEGDLIARLDQSDFETQVAQLQSAIDQANAELRALKSGARDEEILALEAAVESAQAQVDQARDQAERTRQLAQSGVAAQARVDQDEANLRVAEANLKAQQEQLRIGQAGGRAEEVEAAEAAIRGLQAQLRVAQNNLDYSSLRAPFDGIIARRDIENFSNVQAGQNVALLQALSVVHLAFDVPAPDVTALTANGVEKIVNSVMFDALPGEVFASETVEFSVQADSATQTYRGRVAVTVPEGAVILPGMVGRVLSRAPGNGPALSVPLTAIASRSDGAPFVWLVDDAGKVAARDVTLGDLMGGHVVVREGLSEGDTIISAGVGQIMEGMTIRPITRVGG